MPCEKTKTTNKIMVILIVSIAVIVYILCIGIFLRSFGRSYQATVDQWLAAVFTGDAEGYLKLTPKKAVAYTLEKGENSGGESEIVQEIRVLMEQKLIEVRELYGEDWEVAHAILDTENIAGAEFEKLNVAYVKAGVKITAAKKVHLAIAMRGKDVEEGISTDDVILVKMGRSWYLDTEIILTNFRDYD
jgi:hypothetical protein